MDSAVPVLIPIVLLLIVIGWLVHRLTYWSRQNIPNEIGSLYNRLTKPISLADLETYTKYGRVVGIYDGLRPCLMVGEEDLVRRVLVEEFDKFQNHRIFYSQNQIAGRSLLSMEDDQWKRLRRVMTPLFASGNLKKMRPLIEECSFQLVRNLARRVEIDPIVDMKQLFGAYALDVLASTVFGLHQLDSFNSQNHEIVVTVAAFLGQHLSMKSLFCLWFPWIIKWFNWYVFDYQILVYLNAIVQGILNRSRLIKARTQSTHNQLAPVPSTSQQQPKPLVSSGSTGNVKDFLTLLDEAEIKLDEKELDNQTRERIIIDNGILFIIAGYDTTSTSLGSIVFCLSVYPEYQQKIVDEIDGVRKRLGKQELSFEEMNSLVYLNACIHEGLRCFPAVPRIERRVNRNCKLGDIKLLKDSLVIIPTYAINHDPKYFPNPDTYDPNRFINNSSSDVAFKMDHIFLPFASGPRNCIGRRFAMPVLQICLIHLLTSYRFNVSFRTKIPLQYYVGMPVASPKEIKVMVTPRDKITIHHNIQQS